MGEAPAGKVSKCKTSRRSQLHVADGLCGASTAGLRATPSVRLTKRKRTMNGPGGKSWQKPHVCGGQLAFIDMTLLPGKVALF